MKILDFTKITLDTPVVFNKETIMVMCYTPKVIVFETPEEIWKFKAVCEIYLSEPLEERPWEEQEKDSVGDMTRGDICRVLVDEFEEESFMFKDSKYKSTPLVISEADQNILFDSSISVHTNFLRYDMYVEMEWLEVLSEEITKLLSSDNLDEKLKADTQEMFKVINSVFIEDLAAWKSCVDYFRVQVTRNA